MSNTPPSEFYEITVQRTIVETCKLIISIRKKDVWIYGNYSSVPMRIFKDTNKMLDMDELNKISRDGDVVSIKDCDDWRVHDIPSYRVISCKNIAEPETLVNDKVYTQLWPDVSWYYEFKFS